MEEAQLPFRGFTRTNADKNITNLPRNSSASSTVQWTAGSRMKKEIRDNLRESAEKK
jgi:hypothetical protein